MLVTVAAKIPLLFVLVGVGLFAAYYYLGIIYSQLCATLLSYSKLSQPRRRKPS